MKELDGGDLRASILQKAIQGRLVPQDPSDEPASVLIDRIAAEKAELVRQKRIKKPRNVSRIYRREGKWYETIDGKDERCIDEEIPFEIPGSWTWARGEQCFEKMESRKPAGSHFEYIDIDAIDNQRFSIANPKRLESSKAPSRASRAVHTGDVLFSMVRPYLRNIALIDESHKDCIASTGFYVCTPKPFLDSHYLYWIMISNYVVDGLTEYMKGDNSPSINNSDIENYIFPIPPINEQNRIVQIIKQATQSISRYQSAHSEYVELVSGIPARFRESVLQEAIQGRLVPQDPSDEPASVLIDRIAAEKAELVRQKRIKKPRNVSRIYRREGKWYETIDGKDERCIDEEIPFEIPGSWTWARTSTICTKITDGTHHSPPNGPKGDFMYVSAKNIREHGVDTTNITYVSEDIHKEIYSRCNPEKGDILLIKDGATAGIVTMNNLEEEFSLLSSVGLLKTSIFVYNSYVVWAIRSDNFQQHIRSVMKGTGIPRITLEIIGAFLIPIPPLKEQERIVKQLETIIERIETMEDVEWQ